MSYATDQYITCLKLKKKRAEVSTMNNELANKEYWEQEKSNKLDMTYENNPFRRQFNEHIMPGNDENML